MKKLVLYMFIGVILLLLAGCGSDQSGSGAIAFSLSWNTNSPSPKAFMAPPPGMSVCDYYQIVTINAAVLNSSSQTVATGSTACSAHHITISGVPVGTVSLTIEGLVGTTVAWRGQATGINVVADQIASAGTITMSYIGIDNSAPTVTDNAPAKYAVKQKLNVPISAIFSEAVVTDSVSNAVSVSSGTNQIAGLVSYNPSTYSATFTPSSFLTYSTLYTVTIGTGVEDLAAHQLAAPFTWSFTTNDYPNTVIVPPVTLTKNVSSVSLTPDGKYLYGSNGPAVNSVSVISMASYNVVATIPTGTNPGAVAITPDGGHVYVANAGSNSVSVIQTSDNTVIQTISVGTQPSAIAVTPDGNYVYVSNFSSNSVSVIRTSDNTVTYTFLSIGYYVSGLRVTPDGKYVYVTRGEAAADGADSVSVIKTADNTVTGPFPTCGTIGSDIILTSDGSYAYITCSGGPFSTTGSVVVMRTADKVIITTIPLAPNVGTGHPRITPDGSYLYVTNSQNNNLSIIRISDNILIDTRPLFYSPYDIAMSPDGSTFYITTGPSNYLLLLQRP